MASYQSGGLDYNKNHFLQACFLCRKHLGFNTDIFMYRGDKAFCSKECRADQMETDEAKEKNLKGSSRSRRKVADGNDSGSRKSVRRGSVLVLA